MIFNDDLLFLHVPKTGGMSVTRYLLETLPKPLAITHPVDDPDLHKQEITHLDGARHESLAEARDMLAALGRDIREFQMVLVGMRNPYDQEVSRYAFLRQGHHWELGPEQDLALASDFETFALGNCQAGGRWKRYGLEAERARPNEIRDYYMLDGVLPDGTGHAPGLGECPQHTREALGGFVRRENVVVGGWVGAAFSLCVLASGTRMTSPGLTQAMIEEGMARAEVERHFQ